MQAKNKMALTLLAMPELTPISVSVSVRLQLMRWMESNQELKKAFAATRKKRK